MLGERSRYGLLVSTFGAIALVASVYLPWYGLSIAGAERHVILLSAHRELADLSIVLPVLGGLALLDSIIPLVRSSGPVPAGGGASVLLLGSVAAVCVLYRMLHMPTLVGGPLTLSLREGSWLALLGSLAMIAGGLWPRRVASSELADSLVSGVWPGVSRWTPQG
jgi:hypothetical protein